MSLQSAHQLLLLADHLKLSLLERQRAVALNLEPHKEDSRISRNLSELQEGIEALESQQSDLGQPDDSTSDLSRLRKQYEDLYGQFHGSAPPTAESRASAAKRMETVQTWAWPEAYSGCRVGVVADIALCFGGVVVGCYCCYL